MRLLVTTIGCQRRIANSRFTVRPKAFSFEHRPPQIVGTIDQAQPSEWGRRGQLWERCPLPMAAHVLSHSLDQPIRGW